MMVTKVRSLVTFPICQGFWPLGIIHIGLFVALKSPETTYRNSLHSILCVGWNFVIM